MLCSDFNVLFKYADIYFLIILGGKALTINHALYITTVAYSCLWHRQVQC